MTARARRVLEEEVLLVTLLGVFAALFVTAFPPTLLVADGWLTLMAGREIVEHGLPATDAITVLGLDRTWTDQQWGAQLLLYGAHVLGGIPLVVVLTATLVVGAFSLAAAAAISLGASSRAFLVIFFPVIAAAPWAWNVRAQVVALPLFVGLLWLLASESRRPSRRALLAVPILLVWANVHGSVALGALLTMIVGGIEAARARRLTLRSMLFLVVPPLLVLATPYGPAATARYYHLLLVDPPFGDHVTEWHWSDPAWDTFTFYLLAALAAVVVWRGRARLVAFDLVALGLTFVGAVTAIRGIVWFAMTCSVLLPVAVGPALGRAGVGSRRVNRAIAAATAVLVVVAVAFAFARPGSAYLRKWPEAAVTAVRQEADRPGTRVLATSRHADWLLWRIPGLRGRMAWDVRFEIYSPEDFNRIVHFRGEQGAGWKSVADGYDVVVLETHEKPSHIADFLAEPGARVVYRDEHVTVIARSAAR